MVSVGLDFDNTIACYDFVFPEVAADLGLVTASWQGGKQQLRDYVRTLPNGEEWWQRIQGRVYGRYMHRAVLFPGAAEFLLRCRVRGARVSIVSHKTMFGHFDPDKIPLREAALQWMDQQGFFSGPQFGLRTEDVYFAETREEKLRQIEDRACDIFVDDLIEVLAEPEFPRGTRRILYSPGTESQTNPDIEVCGSWKEIGDAVFDVPSEAEILDLLALRFPEIHVRSVDLQRGRGNSRIFKVTDAAGASYALKSYPDLQRDPRPRRQIEFDALALCYSAGLPVPRPVASDSELNWGIYEWIDSVGDTQETGDFVAAALSFAASLREQARTRCDCWSGLASQACLSGAELERQIRERITALESIADEQLEKFLQRELAPVAVDLFAKASVAWPGGYAVPLPIERQTLSPSDFGSHNSIAIRGGARVFIDFEYFGWDDPAKLIADFVWHPAMDLAEDDQRRWIEGSMQIFADDPDLKTRVTLALPLYGVRWCLILLNEFRRSEWNKRLQADGDRQSARERILGEQLAKARRLLERIQKTSD